MTTADLSKLQALPVSEKLMLVDALLESIDAACDDVDVSVSDAVKRELDTRWAQFEQDPSRALPLEEFRALVKAKRG